MPDITKLILLSRNAAFKNNSVYEGSLNITGSVIPGLNIREFTVPLSRVPDLVSALFSGPADPFGGDPRPASGWFKQGYIYVTGDNAGAGYIDYPTVWRMSAVIRGQNAIIRCTYVQQFSDPLTLDSTAFNYRILDYSAF